MNRAILVTIVLFVAVSAQAQQAPIDGVDARSNPAEFAKQLEGYQLQEKNKEVRLALDWALYRMGRAEALYRVIDDLDSGRQDQVIGYLSDLESPDLLYPFLKRSANAPRISAGLLKALARIGDTQTLELIKPFRESHQQYVAEAAEIAYDEIEKRLGAPVPETRARPRTVEKAPDRP
jgi:HEAT repeat protein